MEAFARQFRSPLVLILIFAAIVSAFVGEGSEALIIAAIVLASCVLSFTQEYGASRAMEALTARIARKASVLRDGRQMPVAVEDIVPGDVIALSAGNLIPADGILLEAGDFNVSESALTGETFPVVKAPGVSAPDAELAERANAIFTGTSVRSGMATMLAVRTGEQTEFASIAATIARSVPETEFNRGIRRFGYLMTEAQSIQIVTQDNKTLPAQSVGYDLATGFGLVRPLLPLRDIKPVALGSIKDVEAGQPLMAATGNQSDGNEGEVNMTQVVSKRAFSGYWEYHLDAAIFTSPPIANHSGAPVFNHKGELVGIGSLYVGDAMGGNRRLPGNMFVPVDLLKPILGEMQQTGSSRQSHRPWLGLTSSEQSGRIQILRVNRESPAQAAGLQPGDVVLAVDGAKVSALEGFYKKLWDRASPDASIELTVLQGADIKKMVLKAVDRMSTMSKPSGI